jgi:lipopolysaccharide transport system permease protein
MLEHLREIFSYRELVRSLVSRDLRVRYKRSVLGVGWAFAEPLALMLIFTVVFSHILRLSVPRYPLFALSGVVVWSFFSTGVTYALGSVSGNASLVKKIYFPRAVLPLTTVLGRFVHLVLSLVLLVPFLLYFGASPSWALVWLAPLLVVHFLLVAGLALFLSALSTLYEDVGFLVSFAFTGLFYLSPVVYPLEAVPDALRPWYAANPMAAIISAYRAVLLGSQGPRPGEIALASGIALSCFLFGLVVFRRLEPRFAEVL